REHALARTLAQAQRLAVGAQSLLGRAAARVQLPQLIECRGDTQPVVERALQLEPTTHGRERRGVVAQVTLLLAHAHDRPSVQARVAGALPPIAGALEGVQ